MKTSKTSSKKSLNGQATQSRRRQTKNSASRTRKKKKAEKELTADELTLIAWESLYKKRDKFISMWD
ncbi:MAG TPA: hypothetical protein VNQ79_22750 [Blastocatellia bacterium]|nr:hypothetical protein [Blastocatellia bacterium]